jgi:WD40 repeat protein
MLAAVRKERVYIYASLTYTLVATLAAHAEAVSNIAWSADGFHLATACHAAVYIWDMGTFSRVAEDTTRSWSNDAILPHPAFRCARPPARTCSHTARTYSHTARTCSPAARTCSHTARCRTATCAAGLQDAAHRRRFLWRALLCNGAHDGGGRGSRRLRRRS